jgi:CBS domain-containing protein
MEKIKDILASKDKHVTTIHPEMTVLDAAILMNEHRIGCVVVMVGERPVGMFSERDILRRIVAPRLDPGRTLVREVMTTDVICCEPETSVEEAKTVMKNRRIRHLPVVDGEHRLIGLISIGDLNAYNSNSQERTIQVLEQYLYGRV